jgi:hypothetical protein
MARWRRGGPSCRPGRDPALDPPAQVIVIKRLDALWWGGPQARSSFLLQPRYDALRRNGRPGRSACAQQRNSLYDGRLRFVDAQRPGSAFPRGSAATRTRRMGSMNVSLWCEGRQARSFFRLGGFLDRGCEPHFFRTFVAKFLIPQCDPIRIFSRIPPLDITCMHASLTF